MIYRRQTYLVTKEKVDTAEEKRAQQQEDNLLRNSPLIKLQGKTNFLPWFGGIHQLVDKLPKTCDDMKQNAVGRLLVHRPFSLVRPTVQPTLPCRLTWRVGQYSRPRL